MYGVENNMNTIYRSDNMPDIKVSTNMSNTKAVILIWKSIKYIESIHFLLCDIQEFKICITKSKNIEHSKKKFDVLRCTKYIHNIIKY
jgi:hypothetical protein